MTEQNYNTLLAELAEILEEKNHKIIIQRWEIDRLNKKIKEAEAEIKELKGEKNE